MTPEEFLNQKDEQLIVEAIREAEKDTSGEIRVHLEKNNTIPSQERAVQVFKELGMQHTAQKNGVLFYIDVDNKVFSILGDQGINEIVPADFWESIKEIVINHFKQKNYALGLVKGIREVGQKLKEYFPYKSDDVNELPDEISKNY